MRLQRSLATIFSSSSLAVVSLALSQHECCSCFSHVLVACLLFVLLASSASSALTRQVAYWPSFAASALLASVSVAAASVVAGYDADLLYLDARSRVLTPGGGVGGPARNQHHRLDLITSKSNSKIISDYFGLGGIQSKPRWQPTTSARLATTTDERRRLPAPHHVAGSNSAFFSIPPPNSPSTTNSNPIFASSLTSHYQVITICNTLPSILKCQNRQHFLILHRVIYGISDPKVQNQCLPQVSCLQVDEVDEFNCTGSNICVFYPTDRYLFNCLHKKSNLTQIHITCVNLTHLRKYYLQKNRKFDQNYFESNLKQQMNLQIPTKSPVVSPSPAATADLTVRQNLEPTTVPPPRSDELDLEKFLANTIVGLKKPATAHNFKLNLSHLNPTTAGNQTGGKNSLNNENRLATLVLDESNSKNNSAILVIITVFCSIMAVVLISLIYYRMKMKQVIAASSLASNTTINGAVQTNNITTAHQHNSAGSQVSFSNVPAPPPGFENPPSRSASRSAADTTTVIRIKRVDETTSPAGKTTRRTDANLRSNLSRALASINSRMLVIRANLTTWMSRTENCTVSGSGPAASMDRSNQMRLNKFQRRQQQVSQTLVQNLPRELGVGHRGGGHEQVPVRVLAVDSASDDAMDVSAPAADEEGMSDDYQATPVEVRHRAAAATALPSSSALSSSASSLASSAHSNGTRRTESSNHYQLSSKWMMRNMPSPPTHPAARPHSDSTTASSSNSAYAVVRVGPQPTKYATAAAGRIANNSCSSSSDIYYQTPMNANVNAATGRKPAPVNKLIINEEDALVPATGKDQTAKPSSSGKILVFKRSKLKTPALPAASKAGPVTKALAKSTTNGGGRNEDESDCDRFLAAGPDSASKLRQQQQQQARAGKSLSSSPTAANMGLSMVSSASGPHSLAAFDSSTSSLGSDAHATATGQYTVNPAGVGSASSTSIDNSSSSSSDGGGHSGYYQRTTSGCGGVNFSHMLYDIPEEEGDISSDDEDDDDEEDVETDNDASSNYVGILKI